MSKKKTPGFPYDATPDVHRFQGNADSCFTENMFPMIAQALPKKWEKMRMDKPDLEREE